MKKKLFVGILSGSLILGVSTFAFAQEAGVISFDEMRPHIEKMHPELTPEEQKEMFEACHGEGGMMENYNPDEVRNMMNRF